MRVSSLKLGVAGAIVGLVSFLMPAHASAATLVYPSAGCPLSSGLSSCISSAGDGDTIKIKPGNYDEGFTVTHAVSVVGPCKGKPAAFVSQGIYGANVTNDGVTLKCLSFRNGGASANAVQNLNPNDHLHLFRLKIANYGYGVYTNGGTDLEVKRSTISTIANDAIHADGPTTNGVVSGNRIANVNNFCMLFNQANPLSISRNDLVNCNNTGIYVQTPSDNVTVKRNKIHTGNGYGMIIESDDAVVDHNRVGNVGNAAFHVVGVADRVTNNAVTGDTNSDAFDLSGGDTGIQVTGNKARGANGYFIDCPVCDNATISNNKVTGRVAADGIFASGTTLTVTGNKILGGAHGSGLSVQSGTGPIVNKNVAFGGFGSPGIVFECIGGCTSAQFMRNQESGTYDDYGIVVSTGGCAASPCMTISRNKASENSQAGFNLDTDFAQVSRNTSSRSGFGASGCNPGFVIAGDNAGFSHNVSTSNACDGFTISGSGNVLARNRATSNGQMGFHDLSSADATTFDHNVAKGNVGDGVNNDGTNTNFMGNTASGNRQDCTNDGLEGATTVTVSGNHCADGTTNFPDSTLDDVD